MLQPIQEGLSRLRIVLASGSPRRKEMIGNVGLNFEIIPSTFEENLDKSKFAHASEYVKENAKQKAIEVFQRLSIESDIPDLVIGADTVVVHENKILEKPKNGEDAFSMLKRLSGRKHEVYSGVSFVWSNQTSNTYDLKVFHECTHVEFGELSDDVIYGYISTKEPLDKAGGYGIQGLGGTLVKSINGDYFNVVGFPLFKFCCELKCWYSNCKKMVKT